MFESSKDIFYIVLSFCIFWLTVFLCWALYYLIRMLKQTNALMSDMRDRIEQITNVITVLKSKLVEYGMKGLMNLFHRKKEEAVTRKSKTKSKKA